MSVENEVRASSKTGRFGSDRTDAPDRSAMNGIIDTAKALYDAYVAKDRAAAEALIADDFHFTSPLDNGIDRASYFAICWPNSANTAGFEIIHVVAHGEQVFVTYEGQSKQSRFRNTEIFTVRDGQIVAVEVYFGWNVPHEVAAGEHRDPK